MKISIKNAKKMQTLKGWGTSACWWSQYCEDSNTAREIASLLYGSDGLNLNIYRYNIGGGTDDDNCRIANPWRRTDSFYVFDKEKMTGEYDFSRDENAVNMMRLCLDTGNVDTLILFCNSPHFSQTSTGQTSGSMLNSTCNIPKMNYKKFTDYVLDVTEHFLEEGLPVKYISPINEPQWKWGGSHIWQEGCHYEPDEVAEIYHIFADEIIKRSLPVKLYGPESGEMLGRTGEYFEKLTADETIMQVLDVFAYHSYHSDDKPRDRIEFKEKFVNNNPDLRFDMSEWCELPNKSHTENFKGALITARIIGQDIIYGGAESWTSWVAVNQFCKKEDGLDYSDGLISANDDFSEWHIAKRYWGFAHFSKFIPIGATALDIGFFPDDNNELNIFAFEAPNGEKVLVAVNEGDGTDIEIESNCTCAEIYESTGDYELKHTKSDSFNGILKCKKESIVTVILK